MSARLCTHCNGLVDISQSLTTRVSVSTAKAVWPDDNHVIPVAEVHDVDA